MNLPDYVYFAIDPTKKKWDFTGTKTIKEKDVWFENHNKFNVYKSINTFWNWKRTERSIWQFIWIWIDVDMDKTNGWISDEKTIVSISQKHIWIKPYKINKTWNWYHIYFNFSDDLWGIDIPTYKKIYEYIRDVLEGDKGMVSATWILRVVDFIDWKIDKETWTPRNFMIKEIYSSNDLITKETLSLLKIKPEYRYVDFEDEILKKEKKRWIYERNRDVVNEMDSLLFVEKLNNGGYNIDIRKMGEWYYDVWDTNWLKLYNSDWIWRFKDFSGHNRFTNDLFVRNYLLKDIENEKDRFSELAKIYMNIFWISLNTKKAHMSISMALDIVDRRFSVWDVISEGVLNRNVTNIEIIRKKYWSEAFVKFVLWLFTLEVNEKLSGDWFFIIEMNKLLSHFWLSKDFNNRKMIMELFDTLSSLETTLRVNDIVEGKSIWFIQSERPFTVRFSEESGTTSRLVWIKINDNCDWKKYIRIAESMHLLTKQFSKNNNWEYEVAMRITMATQSFWMYKRKITTLQKDLWYNYSQDSKNKVKVFEFLDKCISNKIFWSYEEKNWSVIIYNWKKKID